LDRIWTPRPLPCASGPRLDLDRFESLDLTAGVWHHSCLARTRAVENAFRMSSPSCPWRRRRQHFGSLYTHGYHGSRACVSPASGSSASARSALPLESNDRCATPLPGRRGGYTAFERSKPAV
jgi:hypothetical protein